MRILRFLVGLTSFLASAAYAADLTYNPVPLCRFVDTRVPAAGGMLTDGVPRSFRVTGAGFGGQGGEAVGCGVPSGALAVHVNLVAVNPTGAGNLRGVAYPATPTRNLINYQSLNPNLNIANAITVEICDPAGATCTFDLTVAANGAAVHLVGDVAGFYTADHKHEGEDITTGTVAEPRIDAAIARDTEIMPAVLDADGETSGLDADLLDGKTSSEFALSSHDHDSQYEKKYVRTVVVTGGGSPEANGAALLAALDSITSASPNSRFLIKLEPGIYELVGPLPLNMKEYVDIEGSGEQATIIRRAGASSEFIGTIVGANDTELRFLRVENTGSAPHAVGIFNNLASVSLVHVVVNVSEGTVQNIGVYNINSNRATYRHVLVAALGGSVAYGLRQQNAAISLFDVELIVVNGNTNYGLYGTNSVVTAENIRIRAENGTQAFAVNLAGDNVHTFRQGVLSALGATSNTVLMTDGGRMQLSQVEALASGSMNCTAMQMAYGNGVNRIRNSSLRTEGCTNSFGMNILNTNLHITHSVIEGASNTLFVSGTVAFVASSQLLGGPVFPTGGAVCAGVVDEGYMFFANTCPP